jgi:hypothetical protein
VARVPHAEKAQQTNGDFLDFAVRYGPAELVLEFGFEFVDSFPTRMLRDFHTISLHEARRRQKTGSLAGFGNSFHPQVFRQIPWLNIWRLPPGARSVFSVKVAAPGKGSALCYDCQSAIVDS